MTTFHVELRRAMAARNVNSKQLAALIGRSPSMIAAARSGDNLPTHGNIDLLATALEWPALVRIGRLAHTARCPVCSRQFVSQMRNGLRRYCGRKCQHTASGRRRRKRGIVHPYRVAAMRLAEAQAAIAAFCARCQPDDLTCRDNTCELRSESPLPFVPLSKVSRRVA